MAVTSPLGLAVGIALALVAVWTSLQAWWALEDRRTFVPATGFLLVFGVSSIILSTSLAQLSLPRLLANVAGAVAFFCLAVWFLCALRDHPGRRVALQLLVLVAALGVAVAAWVSAPDQVQRGLASGTGPRGPAAATFEATIELYLASTQVQLARWSQLYARRAEGKASRWGFTALAAGLVMQVVMTGTKVVTVAVASLHGAWSPALLKVYLGVRDLRAPSDALMLAGAGYSAVVSLLVALPVWRAHRRDQLRMQPLRRLLYSAFPEHALDPVPALWRDWLIPVRVHWRFYRCLIETLDGLDQLCPFYDDTVAARAETTAAAGGMARTAAVEPNDYVRAVVLFAAVQNHVAVTASAEAAATAAGLSGEAREMWVFTTLAAEAARSAGAGHVYRSLDDVDDGTMEQVAGRLLALSAAVGWVTHDGFDFATASSMASPSLGQ